MVFKAIGLKGHHLERKHSLKKKMVQQRDFAKSNT